MHYDKASFASDLLSLGSSQVMPYLERVGKRLESGIQCWPHVLVVVETEQRENYTKVIAYVDAAQWEPQGYYIPEGEVAFEVPPRALVRYASDGLICSMYGNGLLTISPAENMPAEEKKLIEQALKDQARTYRRFAEIRNLVGKEFL